MNVTVSVSESSSANWGYYTEILTIISATGCIMGTIMNIPILLCMPLSEVMNKARLYYFTIAFFDTFLLIFQTIFHVCYWNADYCVCVINGASCLSCQFIYKVSEFSSNVLVYCFSTERCIAVLYPFAASKLTYGRTKLVVAAVMPITFGLTCMVIPISTIDYSSGAASCYYLQNLLGMVLYPLGLLLQETLPSVLLCVSTVILSLSLHSQRLKSVRAEDNAAKKTSERSAILVLIALSVLRVLAELPMSIAWAASLWLTGAVYTVVLNLGYLFWACSAAIHSCNFFIYFFRIPAFRSAVKKVFCCNC